MSCCNEKCDCETADAPGYPEGTLDFKFTSVKTKQGKTYGGEGVRVIGVFDAQFKDLLQVDVLKEPDLTKNRFVQTSIVIPADNVAELISEVEVPDPRQFVQVVFLDGWNTEKTYTYVNPGLDLMPGDIVLVDTVHGPNNEARVVALGKGTLHTGSYKAVKARLVKPPLGIPLLEALGMRR